MHIELNTRQGITQLDVEEFLDEDDDAKNLRKFTAI